MKTLLPEQEPLWNWLRHPSRWTRSQQLAMAALVSVAASLFGSRVGRSVGDAFAYIALLLVAVLVISLAWRRLVGGVASVSESVPGDESGEKSSPWFWAALILTLVAFAWLYLAQMFIIHDPNPEAMISPLTVAYAERALTHGRPPSIYFRDDAVWGHLKSQDPYYACSPTYRGRLGFEFEWHALLMPVANAIYIPIVKVVGLSYRTIAWYSTLLSLLVWGGTALLAWRMCGRWPAVLSALLMVSCLTWLIHVRVGYGAWMPSVLLMVLSALCLHGYATHRRYWLMAANGFLLGLMYLMGWIVVVFGIALAVAVVMLCGPRNFRSVIKDSVWCLAWATATAVFLAWVWALYYGYTAIEVHRVIFEQMFGRFGQGEPGLLKLSIGERMAYAFRCLFVDSRTLDGHVDKYLEGQPAIPWLLSGFLAVGVIYGIKTRGGVNKLLLLWLLVVLAVLGTVFIFGHRYALLAVPAMSIVAAQGIWQVGQDLQQWRGLWARKLYGIAVAVALAGTVVATYREYYVQYLHQKAPDFEMDRQRGHYEFSEWLKKTGESRDTLVVMGDPVFFPHNCFLFNTFGWNYPYVYWSNYFRTGSTSEQVRAWEQQLPANIRRIVYAFSPTLLGDPKRGLYINDPRPFLAAHSGLKPCWSYSYAGRSPLILAFEVRR